MNYNHFYLVTFLFLFCSISFAHKDDQVFSQIPSSVEIPDYIDELVNRFW
jgi:hypothetical protein